MENNIFNASSVPQIENGAAHSSASVSICTVALELGISLSDAKGMLAGKHAAKLYRDKYKQPPSKHYQTIRGTVLMVNSYTQKDRNLLETAIKAVAWLSIDTCTATDTHTHQYLQENFDFY